jgi:hypothetical protein
MTTIEIMTLNNNEERKMVSMKLHDNKNRKMRKD